MRLIASIWLFTLVAGCASNAQRIDALARSAELERFVIESNQLRSLVYLRAMPSDDSRLVVFLEGDGQPWHAGIVPNEDPTTRDPLALELLLRTPGKAAYVARPCYQAVPSDRCSYELWTNARYSESIVNAMVSAIIETSSRAETQELVLVGHSGGGVLAVLIAERMKSVVAVVTIAANLDIDAWTKHHQYLPLSGSLNPARSDREHPWIEVHLAGRKDVVVPSDTTNAYFERYPGAHRWTFEEHGHKCCWVEEWEQLRDKIEKEIDK